MKKWVIITVLAAGFSGCYYDKEEILYPDNNCDTVDVTYAGTISPIMVTSCQPCHSNSTYASKGGGYNLDGYAKLKPYANPGGLLVKCVTGDPSVAKMPLAPYTISNCDIQKIQLWVNAGALNN